MAIWDFDLKYKKYKEKYKEGLLNTPLWFELSEERHNQCQMMKLWGNLARDRSTEWHNWCQTKKIQKWFRFNEKNHLRKQTIAAVSCHVVPIENQNMKGKFLLTSHQGCCLLSDRPGWTLGSFSLLLWAESLRGERKPAEILQSLPHIFCLCVSVFLWVSKFYGGEV